METGTAILIVGVGVAGFLLWRAQQQNAVAVTTAQATAAAGIPATGGGVTGLASRAFANWQKDPLGIGNTKQAVGYVVNAGTSAAKTIASGASDVVGFIKGIF